MPQEPFRPRLTLEPNPLYYLRSARSYAFLLDFLRARIGEGRLASLHGLKRGGKREEDLLTELLWIRALHYGCYLLCCDDLGLAPELLAGELDDDATAAARVTASAWLAGCATDPDLAEDTRVAIPIAFDQRSGEVFLWATIGVRLAKISVSYASDHGPQLRPMRWQDAEWQSPASLEPTVCEIAVDTFVEVRNASGFFPNREELRAICDAQKEKGKVIEALGKKR